MRIFVLLSSVIFALLVILFSPPLQSQELNHHFNVGTGAGFSAPTADASGNFNTGWNLDFHGGWNMSPFLLAGLDFTYNRWNLTDAAWKMAF